MQYHKLGGLKQQKLILLQLWRLEVQNQVVCWAVFPPEALVRILPCLFQLLVAPGVP